MIKKIFKTVLLFGLLLFPVFSFAFENTFYPYVPVEINDGQSNILQLTDNVNFLLNDEYKVISVYGGGDYPRLKNVFWNGTGLYFIDSCAGGGSNCQNINTSIRKQGYIQKYYECTLNDSICNVSNTPLKDVSEFIGNSSYSNPDYMFISDTRWNNSALFLCFKYESLNSQICFDFDESLNYYSNSLGFTYNPKPSQYGDSNSQIVSYFTNSPFNNLISLPDYSINPGQCLSNTEVLMGFEYMGLSQEYCYGGFSMNNLFLPGESFEDFTGYSFGYGTTIFNLYYVYSGGLSMKPFLSSYYQSFLNGQLNNFYNKSKALLMFFQQYQSANDRGRGDFNLNDLNDYCTLLFILTENNWSNDNDCYTGGNKSAPISYNLNKSSNNGGFNFTGVLGGNGTGFSTPDEFFGRLSSLFQTNINGIDSTFPSMIPSYIVFFMLAIILIRIISH